MTQLTHISQMVDIAKYRLCLIGVTPVPSYHDGMVVEFSKRMTCTWNIFGMNSWNGNLIIHETGGVSWLNVSVSQATCQTSPLSNDDDGCSSLEQSVWWWSCTFLFDGGLRSFWILMLLPLKPTYLVPEKVDALTDYTFSLPVFWWEITHQKIRSCEANLVINKFTNHIVGDPKKDSLSSFCTRKLRCNVEFLSFPTCHQGSLSLGKSAWQGDM